MINYIRHIFEPTRLVLTWMSPNRSDQTQRRRYVVGEILRSNDDITLRYLSDSDDFKKASSEGFGGYPAYKPKIEVHGASVLDTFLRRLPPRSRMDFPKYLEKLRLPLNSKISDFALLGYSEAKLPGDGFSILIPFLDAVPPVELLSEIAGFRYYAKLDGIKIGQDATFESEPGNAHDPNAIKVMISGQHIGYVNRIHAPVFNKWLNHHEVFATIERINGTNDRPLVHLFVKVFKATFKMNTVAL